MLEALIITSVSFLLVLWYVLGCFLVGLNFATAYTLKKVFLLMGPIGFLQVVVFG